MDETVRVDGGNSVCASLFDDNDLLLGDLYYDVFVFVLSLDVEVEIRACEV